MRKSAAIAILVLIAACAAPNDEEDEVVESALTKGGYSKAAWVAANPARVHGSRPASSIKRIVIHALAGYYTSQISAWKREAGNETCAQFVVSKKGAVTQMMAETDIAYHVPNNNSDTIGIEHEDASPSPFKTYANDPSWVTDAEYKASAELVAWLALKYDVPIDREHILGHVEVSGNHGDPGEHFDWDRYMGLVKAAASPPPAASSSPEEGKACASDGVCNPGNDGSGFYCKSGRCVVGCRTKNHCKGIATCEENKCVRANKSTQSGY